ncbi:MAG: hypothetical protein WCF22_25215 [Candidatus Sulfotelmatobacter sp.]
MHEFHYAKEQVITGTLHKAFRAIEKYLLLGLMVAIALQAQQSAPSVTTWAGVVRTSAGEPAYSKANEIQSQLRSQFTQLFHRGYAVTNFTLENGAGHYLLERDIC